MIRIKIDSNHMIIHVVVGVVIFKIMTLNENQSSILITLVDVIHSFLLFANQSLLLFVICYSLISLLLSFIIVVIIIC